MVDLYTTMEVTLKVFTSMVRNQKVYIILITESKNAHTKMAKDTGWLNGLYFVGKSKNVNMKKVNSSKDSEQTM